MKRIIFLILAIFFTFTFAGCKTFNKKEFSQDEYIASFISSIENIESFSDETIKTIAAIYKNNKDYPNLITSQINEKILTLTKNAQAANLNKNIKLNIDTISWQEIINNYALLEFFKSKGFDLANISDLNIINNNNGFAEYIMVASSKIEFIEFANYFKLKSNKSIMVEKFQSYIKISGYGNSFNYDCDINEIEQKSKLGLKYEEIIDSIL